MPDEKGERLDQPGGISFGIRRQDDRSATAAATISRLV